MFQVHRKPPGPIGFELVTARAWKRANVLKGAGGADLIQPPANELCLLRPIPLYERFLTLELFCKPARLEEDLHVYQTLF